MPKEIEYIYRNPLLFLMVASGWVLSAIIAYITAGKPYLDEKNEQVLDAHKKIIEAQVQLERLQTEEVIEVKGFLQQIVDTYESPAWVKYLDYNKQEFYFSVINEAYSEVYSVPFIVADTDDTELYKDRDLTPEQRATILEYGLHDRKAVRLGPGRCLKVREYAYPVKRYQGNVFNFKKCMLIHKNTVYVLGYQL